MSIEKIRQLQRQQAEEAARQEREQRAREEEALRQSQERLRQQKHDLEQREQLERSTRVRVLRESGALHNMQRIERELLEGNVRKHALVLHDDGNATLVWGNKFMITNNNIDYERPFFGLGQGVQDYTYIGIKINPATEEIVINDTRITEWWSNKEKVEDALAQAYVDSPHHKVDREEHHSSYDSSSSSNTECCNS